MKVFKFDSNDDHKALESLSKAFKEWEGKGELVIRRQTRTAAQNRALHLYCEWLASELNEYDQYALLQILKIEDFWTADSVKEKIFRQVLKVVCGNEKTSEATTSDIVKTADIIEKNLSEKLGISLAFPSKWSLFMENALRLKKLSKKF